jgi:hypothetical protein
MYYGYNRGKNRKASSTTTNDEIAFHELAKSIGD